MNCEQLQPNLYEYLDGVLPLSQMEAIRNHLEACASCREILEREIEFGGSLKRRFHETVEGIQLEEHVRRRITAAMDKHATEPRRPLWSAWKRVALPLATAAAAAVLIIWIGHRSPPPSQGHPETARISPHPIPREVNVDVMFCVPTYTFHRDGNTVIDALTCDSHVAENSFIVKN